MGQSPLHTVLTLLALNKAFLRNMGALMQPILLQGCQERS